MLEGCDRTGKSTFIHFLEEKIKENGYIPIVFHLMGPNKFQGFTFNNDEKNFYFRCFHGNVHAGSGPTPNQKRRDFTANAARDPKDAAVKRQQSPGKRHCRQLH